jgi:hypothetical protein
VQFSATSQTPAAERQTVDDGSKTSVGQSSVDAVAGLGHVTDAGRGTTGRSRRDLRVGRTVRAARAVLGDVAAPPPSGRPWTRLEDVAGQASVTPSQASAMSQTPAAERQTEPDATFASPGQFALPVQFSATSQTPAAERQTVEVGRKTSAGQFALPVQLSGWSQTPAAERHTVDVGRKMLVGHVAALPVQVSCWSQTPAAERQTCPPVRN